MHINSDLRHIHTKIDEIQIGLLRFQDEYRQVSLQVKAKCNGNNAIDCVMIEKSDLDKLVNGRVNLVQKSDKNYLYISGELIQSTAGDQTTFSIQVLRACWFVLKKKGSVSWLQEKYIYDISPRAAMELAS